MIPWNVRTRCSLRCVTCCQSGVKRAFLWKRCRNCIKNTHRSRDRAVCLSHQPSAGTSSDSLAAAQIHHIFVQARKLVFSSSVKQKTLKQMKKLLQISFVALCFLGISRLDVKAQSEVTGTILNETTGEYEAYNLKKWDRKRNSNYQDHDCL